LLLVLFLYLLDQKIRHGPEGAEPEDVGGLHGARRSTEAARAIPFTGSEAL
jgi:hypothetical protein